MTPDNELLRSYATNSSEEAFAELVQRHINLVYSAALRQVAGDAHLAKDVAQTVFTDLARKAKSLSGHESLTGWLYTSTHFAASKIIRTETRRREREETFMRDSVHQSDPDSDWEKLRPVLDDAMLDLKQDDREAILLRYFENQAFADVGAKLGLNENAARMRVERALDKLRTLLAKRGITTAAALATVVSANAVQVAPATLATTLATASMTAAGTGTITLLQIMTATKLKLAVGALAVAGVTTTLVVQHQSQATLRAQNESLQRQIAQLKTDYDGLSNSAAQAKNAQASSQEQLDELLKLRAEVTALRKQNHSSPNVHQAKLSSPDTNLVAVLDAPTVSLSPAADWKNSGTASPDATMQTLYWAMSKRDQKSFSSLISWDAEAQAKAEALFAAAPESVRERFGSVDGVLYALLSAVPPVAGFAVVSQNVQGDEGTVIEQHQYQDGRVRQNQVTLHRFDDGWRVVFGDERLMRGFDAAVKRATAHAEQPRQ